MKILLKHQAIEKKVSSTCTVAEYPLLTAGDTVIIDAGEPYFWEGYMQLLLSCRPIRNAAQHRQVD